jgi:hypothetical protein
MRAVAVAAVACVAAVSACTTTATTSQPPLVILPTGAALSAPGAMPAYYVVVAGPEVVVRASAGGRVTGSIRIPGASGLGRTYVAAEAFGGADDRHFVIVASRYGDLPGVADVTMFLLTVSPDGRPGQLRQLDFDNMGMPVIGAALSPDGTMLALSLVHEFLPPLYGSVLVITLASGATRTWSGQGAPGYWPGIPAWTGDGTLVVPWWHSTTGGMIPAEITGIRRLDAAAPGGSLTASLTAFPASVPGLQSAMLAPGGGQLIASSCHAAQHTATARIVELSAANGRLVRVLRTQTARFGNDADAADAIFSSCRVLSVAGGGAAVLVQAFAFGRIDNGVFTPLLGATPRVLPVIAAW